MRSKVPRAPLGRADNESLNARHEQAIRTAYRWMERHRADQTRLADYLGVNRSSLSRFLSGSPESRPMPTRPTKLRILERVETWCAVYDMVEEEVLKPPSEEAVDDEYAWFHNHRLRLRNLSNNFEAVQALNLIRELCVQAVYAPIGYRAVMTSDAVLRIGGLVARPEAALASPSLLQHTVDRVLRLEATALASASESESPAAREATPHRVTGYAGYALSFLGVHLGEPPLVAEGVERLFAAAATPHALSAGHWSNLFRLCNELLERELDAAEPAARRAAKLAEDVWDHNVRYTLHTRTYPALLAAWRKTAPDLVSRLDQEKGRAR